MMCGQKLATLEAACRFNRQMTWDLLSCANNLLIRAKSVRAQRTVRKRMRTKGIM